jgi:hypothetical protein
MSCSIVMFASAPLKVLRKWLTRLTRRKFGVTSEAEHTASLPAPQRFQKAAIDTRTRKPPSGA